MPPRAPLPLSPQDTQALIALAQAGRWSQLETQARKALGKHPEALLLHNLLGSALNEQGRHAAAVLSFQRAVQLAPQAPELRFNLAVAQAAAGQLAEAVASYRAVLAARPDLTVAHYNLGTTLQRLGRLDEAEAAFRAALAQAPATVETLGNLGAVLQAQGRLDEAVDHYREALRQRELPRLRHNLGTALRSQGRLDEAAEAFEAALRGAPEPALAADTHTRLGETRWDQGRVDEAVAAYRAALALDPAHAAAHYALGVVAFDGGQLEAALACFEQTTLHDAAERRLDALYKLGRTEAFRAELARQLAAGPHRAPRVATLSAHHAHEHGLPDRCGFCPEPLRAIHHGRLDALAEPDSPLRAALLRDLREAQIAERRQGRLHHGVQSAGHLFKRPEASFRTLAELLRGALQAYRAGLDPALGVYARDFPAEPVFSGAWSVAMRRGGHLSAHIHEEGWLSGVVYLQVPEPPPGRQDGAIAFSLDGDGYPRQRADWPETVLQPRAGDVVFFPSSLFHRTLPFDGEVERICIAFDLAPA